MEKYYLLDKDDPEASLEDLDSNPRLSYEEAKDAVRNGGKVMLVFSLGRFYGEFPSDEYSTDVYDVLHDIHIVERG